MEMSLHKNQMQADEVRAGQRGAALLLIRGLSGPLGVVAGRAHNGGLDPAR
jgi:hypothetical protein